jgi:hypothetical protein
MPEGFSNILARINTVQFAASMWGRMKHFAVKNVKKNMKNYEIDANICFYLRQLFHNIHSHPFFILPILLGRG